MRRLGPLALVGLLVTLACSPPPEEPPGRRIAHLVAVGLHEYWEGVAPDGGIRDEDEHGETLTLVSAARTLADSITDERRPRLRALLDTMLREVRAAAPHARIRALDEHLAAALGDDARLSPPAAPDLARGRATYGEQCATCHGATGLGDGPLAATLDPLPKPLAGPDLDEPPSRKLVFRITSVGILGTPMPAFGHLSEADRWAVAAYLEQLRGADAPPAQRRND